MVTCPYCQLPDEQVKVDFNPSGSQRYLCKTCRRKYTPKPNTQGYSVAIRQRAVQLYVDGLNFRRMARLIYELGHYQAMSDKSQTYSAIVQARSADVLG